MHKGYAEVSTLFILSHRKREEFMRTIFNETQRFSQWWLWLILIGTSILPLYGLYKQLVMGEPYGDNPTSDISLIIVCLLVLGVILLFVIMRLDTTMDEAGIHIKYFPFLSRSVAWSEVKSAEVLNYGFVGGWGIRIWTRYGTVYNTSGNKGLALVLHNGKKLCIGTQKEAELKAALAQYWPK